jgi:valyl-tRNA synthetase
LQEVANWKYQYGHRIESQLEGLGVQLDWENKYFTLDAKRSRIVNDAFIELHRRNLIYRDTRLVNWCCALESVISDMEVEYLTVDKPTTLSLPNGKKVRAGVLHHFRYDIASRSELPAEDGIVVATTRIETMLGDTGIAVHPTDPRYAKWVGHNAVHPILGTLIPIVADNSVDPSFGTGAVKITPAHDPVDYEIGKRHNLASIDLLDARGRLTPNCKVAGLVGVDRLDARGVIIQQLQDSGHYVMEEAHSMRLAVCSRSGDVIEPRVVPQWYIRCQPMAKMVLKKIMTNELQFVNPSARDEMILWLQNMKDWCISRQLWWGHRIPAFQNPCNNEWKIDKIENIPSTFLQDDDVLDTWFSSALLPLSATNPDANVFETMQLVRNGKNP